MVAPGRIALRVAVTFAVAATLWAITINRLDVYWGVVADRYDYLLDLLFAVVTGSLLYLVVLRELIARVVDQQVAIAEVWRAANNALEARVVERTEELQTANRQLQAEIAERARAEEELTRVLELSCHLTTALDLSDLARLTLEYVDRMIGYGNATIWKYEGDELVLLDHRGVLPRDQIPQRTTESGQFPGDKQVISKRRPVIIGDLLDDSEAARAYRESVRQRLLGSDPCSRSWMGVPLVIEGRVIGMLRLDHEQPNYFTEHHSQLAMIIANQAAVAIRNAMSYREARQAAVLNERARLARDLHDSIIQAVYGIMWNMRSAQELLPNNVDRASGLLQRAVNTAKTCLLDLRSLVFELRPELIEQYGLAGLLSRHVESVQGAYPVEFSTEISNEPELPLQAKEALYRIAQEALQNAVKHSQAQQVKLRLEQDLSQVFLEVKDDGVGFDPGAPSPGQLGLVSMRERAAQVGGKLEIISGFGRGTKIQIQVPLQAASAAP
jgi:signal transduction histidine kinase